MTAVNARSQSERIVAGALLSGGVAVAGLGLAALPAHAQPAPMVCQDPNSGPSPTNSCTYQWCPGSPAMKNMPNWDRSKCHPWYFDPNSPVTNSTIIEGFPPPRPPAAAVHTLRELLARTVVANGPNPCAAAPGSTDRCASPSPAGDERAGHRGSRASTVAASPNRGTSRLSGRWPSWSPSAGAR